MAEAGGRLRLAAWASAWLLVSAVALFELGAQRAIRARVPSDESWEAASAFVRARYQPSDRIVAAPSWADPIVRSQLGDLLSLRMAAPPDSVGIDRIWEIGLRGARSGNDSAALSEDFDGVRVRMWPTPSDALVYDFVDEIKSAQVELVQGKRTKTCSLREASPSRGGLEHGPMAPGERFVCGSRRPWLWVGATVLSDLELQARRCIWQHPAGPEPVRVTFPDATLGDRLLVHGGIDYQSERKRVHAPVTLRVWINGGLAGELIHEDGDGWSGLEIDTSELDLERASVRFETTAADATARLFCWSASASRGRE